MRMTGMLFAMFIPVIVWFGIVMGIVRAVKGNFKNANTRTATRTPQRRQMGRTAFSKPQPTVKMSSQRPQMQKGLIDMNLDRKKAENKDKGFSIGGLFKNSGFDRYESKGRRKDFVSGYDKNLWDSETRMRRSQARQYSHTYDGHEPWDKCLPKEKDPWDPDFYA